MEFFSFSPRTTRNLNEINYLTVLTIRWRSISVNQVTASASLNSDFPWQRIRDKSRASN